MRARLSEMPLWLKELWQTYLRNQHMVETARHPWLKELWQTYLRNQHMVETARHPWLKRLWRTPLHLSSIS